MGKVIAMQNNEDSAIEQTKNKTISPEDYNHIQKSIVLSILERGEKPTKNDTVAAFQKHMQQHNISWQTNQDIWTDISTLFSEELTHNDIKLLANMYEDMGTHTFKRPEFSIDFDQIHDSKQALLDATLDDITLLLDRQTVKQLMLWTKPDLLYTLSQATIPENHVWQVPKIHPLRSKYIRKRGPSDGSNRLAA